MVSGLPVRGSNRVTVIRTSHNSTPPADCSVPRRRNVALCPEKLIALDRLLVLR